MLDKKELADFLRNLAVKIEKGDVPLIERKLPDTSEHEIAGFFNHATPDSEIQEILEKKDINDLKGIVRWYGLDPKQAVRKWKEKERIIEFIIDKRRTRINRYDGF